MEYFDKDELFRLMVRYTDAFMMEPETFAQRIGQIAEKAGDDWTQVIWDLYWKDEESIFEAIGYLRESDWAEAIAAFSGCAKTGEE